MNRTGEGEDRIVLRVRLRLGLPKGQRSFGEPRSLSTDLRWTLGRVGSGWRLLTIDRAALSDEVLSAPLIAGAWADEDRLWEEALAELAAADVTHGPIQLKDVVSADAPVADQLSELSIVDRRFDNDLLLARLKRIVETWEESCAGSKDLLTEVAASGALDMLLHGPSRRERVRMILHDARIDSWTPTGLELGATPQIDVTVVISAIRYVVSDRTGAWAAGDTKTRHTIHLDWTLTLHRDAGARWELTATTNPLSFTR